MLCCFGELMYLVKSVGGHALPGPQRPCIYFSQTAQPSETLHQDVNCISSLGLGCCHNIVIAFLSS